MNPDVDYGGSGSSGNGKLRQWLIEQVDCGKYPGLVWENDEKTIFRIPWKHAGKQDYNRDEDAALFKVRDPHPPGSASHKRAAPFRIKQQQYVLKMCVKIINSIRRLSSVWIFSDALYKKGFCCLSWNSLHTLGCDYFHIRIFEPCCKKKSHITGRATQNNFFKMTVCSKEAT